jgi:hypothetical protein
MTPAKQNATPARSNMGHAGTKLQLITKKSENLKQDSSPKAISNLETHSAHLFLNHQQGYCQEWQKCVGSPKTKIRLQEKR